MSKKIYLVSGSQDGVLGVFSNMKKAFAEAERYAAGGHDTDLKTTYKQVCTYFKENNYSHSSIYIGEGYAPASIMLLYLNR